MIENKENNITITDVDFDIMQEMLRYIYTDKVENINEMAPALLLAADKVTRIALCNASFESSNFNLLFTVQHRITRFEMRRIFARESHKRKYFQHSSNLRQDSVEALGSCLQRISQKVNLLFLLNLILPIL